MIRMAISYQDTQVFLNERLSKYRANKIKQPPHLTLEIVPETEQDRTVSLFHNQKTITILLHFADHPTQLNSPQQ